MAVRAVSAPRASKMRPATLKKSSGGNPYEKQPSYPDSSFQNATILTSSELDHMTRTVSLHPPQTNEMDQRVALRKTSKGRYKNWGNTLEALREKKKRDRVQKLEEIERGQQKVDHKEMLYQEQQRRNAIDRANRLLFQQNDKVKSLNSALHLSDCMKERGKQIQIHRQRKAHAARLEEMWASVETANLSKMIEREESETIEKKQRSMDLVNSQLEQLRDFRERQKLALSEEIEEGKRTRMIAAEARDIARQQEAERMVLQDENAKEYVRANIEQKKIKDEIRKLEEAEDAKIEQHEKEKERKLKIRREHEAKRAKAKLDQHEKMMMQQYKHLSSLRNQENARLEKDAEEVRARNEANIRAEQLRVANLKLAIDRSRTLQIERKEDEKIKEKALEEVMLAEWARREGQMEEQTRIEEAKERENSRKNQSYVINQIEAKAVRAKAERVEDLDATRHYQAKVKRDDEIFLDYANQTINDYAAKGQSVVPMKLVLAKQARAPRTISIPY